MTLKQKTVHFKGGKNTFPLGTRLVLLDNSFLTPTKLTYSIYYADPHTMFIHIACSHTGHSHCAFIRTMLTYLLYSHTQCAQINEACPKHAYITTLIHHIHTYTMLTYAPLIHTHIQTPCSHVLLSHKYTQRLRPHLTTVSLWQFLNTLLYDSFTKHQNTMQSSCPSKDLFIHLPLCCRPQSFEVSDSSLGTGIQPKTSYVKMKN